MQSLTAENYLKIIYHLSQITEGPIQTSAIAEKILTKASSVTDMVKKLAGKGLVNYTKYQGVELTANGKTTAINIVRKHRLWEVFLVEKLNFKWDEVHDIAEELEHVNSPELIERLNAFLNFPTNDPHGDPIPDKHGNFNKDVFYKLSKLKVPQKGILMGVSEHSPQFLKHLEKMELTLGKSIEVTDVTEFDGSVEVLVQHKKINLSREVAKHLLIKL